jgi:hypothetical protein
VLIIFFLLDSSHSTGCKLIPILLFLIRKVTTADSGNIQELKKGKNGNKTHLLALSPSA